MNVLVLGSGLMGKAIVFDLQQQTSFSQITLVDKNEQLLNHAKNFFTHQTHLDFYHRDVSDEKAMLPFFENTDVVISAVPYLFNEQLTKLAIKTGCHFVDLGGNNEVVQKQKNLSSQAKNRKITVIPDSGLAPGLVSILTRHLVDEYDYVDTVKLRVGGLPLCPKDPWKYQLVFSANGLINEYVEDAIVLDHGSIKKIPSLTQCESINFPKPFGTLEAFSTSGGCSRLPLTYKNKIGYLDYKTIRYPGHLNQIKPLFDLGLASKQPININNKNVKPRDVLIRLFQSVFETEGEDVVLLKVIGEVLKENKKRLITFEMIDYFDRHTSLSAMMRTTGFPVSITADLLARKKITSPGVFTPEEIIPSELFLQELKKRNIVINKIVKDSQ